MTMHDEGGVMLMSEERYKTWLWEEPILVGKDSLFFLFLFFLACPACWGSLWWGGGAVPTGLSPKALPLRVTVPPARTESFTSTLRTEGSGADSGQSGSSW